MSLGREIPLRGGYGLPPKGSTCQDVTGNPPRGFPRSDLGWLHPNLDATKSPGLGMETPAFLHPTLRRANRSLSSASWRNMEDALLPSLSYLAAVENSL